MGMKSESRIVGTFFRVAPWLLLTLAYAGVAQAQTMTLGASGCNPTPPLRTYRRPVGTALTLASGPGDATNPFIPAAPNPGADTWSFPSGTGTCAAGPVCSGLSVSLPDSSEGTVGQTPYFTGTVTGTSQTITVRAARSSNSHFCQADFTFAGVASPLGWGDPHLTTVDGVHYDFQSAGEFTALREDGFEVQTRQSPVPTAGGGITNAYTGITHCVAIYTAVAAKLGSSRVTVQPSPGDVPDSTSMQVRVNGELVTLGNEPYVLYAGGSPKGALEGSITKLPNGVFEIRDVHGTQLVVTSAFWSARSVWYLNVNVYATSALLGTMGKLGARSWLPALPDGSSLGARPATDVDRYDVLYEKFADAWRVTKETSLFDYKGYGPNGTDATIATYTLDEWPRNNPESCSIDTQTSVQGVTEDVAEQACAGVVNAVHRADCVVDVMATGNLGFGKNAEVAQGFGPLPLGWYSPVKVEKPKCEDCSKRHPPKQPWWCCWPLIAIGIVQLALLVFLVVRALKKP